MQSTHSVRMMILLRQSLYACLSHRTLKSFKKIFVQYGRSKNPIKWVPRMSSISIHIPISSCRSPVPMHIRPITRNRAPSSKPITLATLRDHKLTPQPTSSRPQPRLMVLQLRQNPLTHVRPIFQRVLDMDDKDLDPSERQWRSTGCSALAERWRDGAGCAAGTVLVM
jgi:hypothetical protein